MSAQGVEMGGCNLEVRTIVVGRAVAQAAARLPVFGGGHNPRFLQAASTRRNVSVRSPLNSQQCRIAVLRRSWSLANRSFMAASGSKSARSIWRCSSESAVRGHGTRAAVASRCQAHRWLASIRSARYRWLSARIECIRGSPTEQPLQKRAAESDSCRDADR